PARSGGSLPRALSARQITHHFGSTVALAGVSVDVAAGAALALVGESGSGKTTLLRCFNKLIEPNAGQVFVGDVDIHRADAVSLRREIGYVQQHGGLLPHWSVLKNVELVPVLRGSTDPRGAARDALELVGLPVDRFAKRFPHELSGGQRQRVALARSIAARPDVILLDEPFGALDAISRAELHALFDTLRGELQLTTVLVTHDVAEAARLADIIVVMRAGRVEQTGSITALRDEPGTEYVAKLIAQVRATLEALQR
ncbi:MAG TPA: ATP-binding cassette domain-containing protein, partial [Burkholderiales bacterium]|nr:ATP-binding cassette domain-containing protein [Burkholderiales bacterium]